MACRPTDSGLVTNTCQVHTEGSRYLDLKTIQVLPVYETLPNNKKTLSAAAVYKEYIRPALLGAFTYLRSDLQFEIKGVKFAVIECDPPEGYVTMLTKINNTGMSPDGRDSITADNLRTRRLERDEALARQLQRQENNNQRRIFVHSGRALDQNQQEQLQQHLHNIIQQLQGHVSRAQATGNQPQLPFIISQMSQQSGRKGLSVQQISMLPLHKFKSCKKGTRGCRIKKCPNWTKRN
eukprot:UN29043